MAEPTTTRPLTGKQQQFVAAYLGVARGNGTEAARIAGYNGSRRVLEAIAHGNLEKPAIRAAIDEEHARIRREGIAIKQSRIDNAADRHRRLIEVIDKRALEHLDSAVPGASTGLLMPVTRSLRSPDGPVIVEEYRIDSELLKELRELEKQVAQELGEWAINVNQNLGFTFADLFTIAKGDDDETQAPIP